MKRVSGTPGSAPSRRRTRVPALQVAGYFNGGGATSQNLNNRERDLEIDDDVMITARQT